MAKTYAAFKAAGVSEAEAQAAAEEIAGFDPRLSRIEADLLLLKWMVGGLYALVGGLGWMVIRIAAKVGALS